MKQYKYTLDKSSKKHICPNCNKKTFVLYLDTDTGDYLPFDFGRCDREQNCGYHKAPQKSIGYVNEVKTIVTPPIAPSYHSLELLDKMYYAEPHKDNLSEYLKTIFTNDEVNNAMQNYFITGTNHFWNNGTVFWQLDNKEQVHGAKIMLYNAHTGKRVKEPYNHINWLHNAIKEPDFNLKQCLFGLHRINEDYIKPITLVESEKTAIVMSMFLPDFIWLATGSKSNFKREMLEPLKKRKVIAFPDKGEYSNWQSKATELNTFGYNISVSDLIEKTDFDNGFDLADYYLIENNIVNNN